MAVSHVKQMWPWFAGTKAHDWVMQNLFGGRISDATLQFQVVPGRLGNGVPLSANRGVRNLRRRGNAVRHGRTDSPVRDATGVVDFRANDVDIALSSGTVYLPSGKTVAASNCTLSVKRANIPPVIGALDIDVAGDAPAIAELASYDPINAHALRRPGAERIFRRSVGPRYRRHPTAARVSIRRLLEMGRCSRLFPAVDRQTRRRTDGDGGRRHDCRRPGQGGDHRRRPSSVAWMRRSTPSSRSARAAQPRASEPIRLALDDKARETLVPGLSLT